MEEALIVPWPEDKDEFKFACHTSLITENILLKELNLGVSK
jgi:hypothetical protein